MKKRSILVSLVVAVLAALTFVGCSDAVAFPQMPQSVKSGYIVQNGDFLVGQAFDASKFSVMVKYDNGGDPVVLQTATVEWIGDEEKGVQNGDVLSAYVGNDSDNMEVYASGTLTAYTIDTIAVTANVTSYSYKEDAEDVGYMTLPSSDFVVTANYNGGAGTMQLASADFTVTVEPEIAPTFQNPSVAAVAKVQPLTSSVTAEVPVTLAYDVTEIPEAAIVGLKSIAVKDNHNIVIPAFEYDEMPTPDFDDFTIMLDVAGGAEEGYPVTDPSKVELKFVDNSTHLELLPPYALTASTTLAVEASYGDFKPVYTVDAQKISVQPVYITVDVAPEVTLADITEGTSLDDIAINPEDFTLKVRIGSSNYTYERVTADGIKFAVAGLAEGNVPDTGITDVEGTVVPEYTQEGVYLWAIPTYMGASAINTNAVALGEIVETVTPPDPEEVLESITATLAAGYEGPAAVIEYKTVPTAPEASTVSVTGHYVKGTEERDAAITENISVAYSTTADVLTAATETDFSGDTPLYLFVTYTQSEKTWTYAIEITDELAATPYPTSIDYDFNYSMVNSTGEPMIDATIENFEVRALDKDGNVVAIVDDYQFMTDDDVFSDFDPADYVVTGKAPEENDYQVTALLNTSADTQAYLTANTPLELKAGTGWIDFARIRNNLDFSLAADYDNRVGQAISEEIGDYVVLAESYEAGVHGEGLDADDMPKIKITDVEIVKNTSGDGKQIEAEGNSVIFTVTYPTSTGETSTAIQLDDIWTFDGVSYIEEIKANNAAFSYSEEGEEDYEANVKTGFTVGKTYQISKIALSGYVSHGDVADPDFDVYEVVDGERAESPISGSFTPEADDEYQIVINYTTADEVAEPVAGKYEAVEAEPVEVSISAVEA